MEIGQRTDSWQQRALSFPVFAVWWLGFIHTLFYEWWINEQYSFGFLVPFLTAYLLILRWADRPQPLRNDPEWLWWLLPIAAAVCWIPLRVILEANPEWRALFWTQTLLAFGSTLSIIGAVGGWVWVRHFAPALALILFAVPWPMPIEQPIVHYLMRGVAAVTVEALNLLGHFALQEGNLIRLGRGLIGVEEACSGVRSFQSTLMAAYFLGELFRWSTRHRLALMIAGCTVSLVLNLARTLMLTLVAIERGTDAMSALHNPIGHFISLTSFGILFVLTWVLHRRHRDRLIHDLPSAPVIRRKGDPLAAAPVVGICILFVLQYAIAHFWYQRGAEDSAERTVLAVNWNAVAASEERPLPPVVRSVLRYSEAEQRLFRWRNQIWTGFLFRWDSGRISSHVTVHRPEVCLPAAGFSLIKRGRPLVWSVEDVELQFSSHVYRSHGQDYYVFFATWDSSPEQRVPIVHNWQGRLKNAWNALKIKERQSLEIVIVGPGSLAGAEHSMRQFLTAALTIHRPD